MKQRIELAVEKREAGRAGARGLRLNKMVPGVIYGATETVSVQLHVNDVLKYNSRAYENALLNIKSGDSKLNGKVALFKEVVVHPLSRRPEHVDLFALDLTKSVRVSVEVRVEGKPIGLAEGGLLNIVLRQIEVECLPTAIPDFVVADVTNLGVGDSLHVSDVVVPEGVKMISRPELTIAAVVVQEEEVVATPEAAAAAPAAAAGAKAAPGAAPAAAAGKAAPAAAKPAAKK
ncbi:MAG: 50S ribosomal protein L25 [Bdellovibrionales bacterium RIFCSPHIGHO2_01_FULL_40_29]|nr:MAG: 50S ribosomal protein L25 [Bdellovibrionales bacterium RIFCSPHIGHO2_01_FULL_40_29]OFZ33809.1 MAG: 50S ribosomal protein L25 [Bdellovibrionales bacterium RIFCSPHIGHO2_02_FULL_40_15]